MPAPAPLNRPSYTGPNTPVTSTDELANQVSQTSNGNPLYNGAYNPMYNQANGKQITMKDLASLYYKSTGAGVIGDNPHPFHAANVYRDNLKVQGGFIPGVDQVGGDDYLPKSPEEVKKLMQARIDIAGGDRQAVFDQLVNQVNNRIGKETAKKAGLKPGDAQQLAGAGAVADPTSATNMEGMQNWFDQYVDPYVQQQTAMLQYQADLFDDTVAQILPTMDEGKAEIMKAYFPLISAAYHQRASTFANNFISGNDSTSLIGQLMKNSKRNASILKFLDQQNGVGTGGDVSSFMKQFGLS